MNPFASDNDIANTNRQSPLTFGLQNIRRTPATRTDKPGLTVDVRPEPTPRPLDRGERHSSLDSRIGSSVGDSTSKDNHAKYSINDSSSGLWAHGNAGDGSYSPQPRRRRQTLVKHLKIWAPEACWCFVAIIILVVLIILLLAYDNVSMPEWPLSLTLNTVVALLATLCRFVVAIPIAEGISQLKWNWFAVRPRPIKALYAFDQASRGPVGSLRLNFSKNGRLSPLTYVASIVLVTGLVTSFLTQSAIAYSTRSVTDISREAIVKRVFNFPKAVDADGNLNPTLRSDLENALERKIYQAAFIGMDEPAAEADTICSAGNCTWPVFSSLGVCVSMSNITDKLTVVTGYDKRLDASLPLDGQLSLWETPTKDHPADIVNMTSVEVRDEDGLAPFPPQRRTLADWDNPDVLNASFSQFFFIYTNQKFSPAAANTDRYRAVELLWHFCVNTYNVTVTDGKEKTEIVETNTKVEKPGDNTKPTEIILTNADGSEKYGVSSYLNLEDTLALGFKGQYSEVFGGPGNPFWSPLTAQIGKKLFQGLNDSMTADDVDGRLWSNLETATTKIGQSITTHMRNSDPDGEFHGSPLYMQTFVIVRWEWLAFIVAQIGLAIVFLVMVAIHTAKLDVSVVKSSNVAELFALQSGLGGITPNLDDDLSGWLKREDGRWSLKLDHGGLDDFEGSKGQNRASR